MHCRCSYHYPLVFLIGILASAPAFAEPQAATNGAPPTILAVRMNADEKITMDGRLDEVSWERAQPATDFKQSEPRNGEPGTERTEIRIIYNGDSLYIGARLFDSDPNGLLGNQMVRDGALASDDRFMWVLDPFYDQRSGYFFEINPVGAMGDAQLVPSQTGGTFGSAQNRAWDGIWLARVRSDDQGWTAEIEIPFRTISFDPQGQAWGANFQRTVRRKNEDSFWSGWGLNQGLLNLTVAGRIEGISDVSQGHGLDVKPYVIGTYRETPNLGTPATFKGDGGIDFFYNFTPQLKANLTINTDFAQTEIDDRQVNLTRFPLFFPEKRDFFLDGSGNFDFSREPNRDLTTFFSRRIGLDDEGRPQKIDYGVKIGGQVGRYNLGLMQVRTGEDRGVPGEDFTVIRPKRQFWRQSYAGFIYTRRATRASNIPDRQTFGADFQLATARFHGSQNLIFNGFFIKTPDGVNDGDNVAAGTRISYPNDLWSARTSFRMIQKNVNPAIGFIQFSDQFNMTPVIRFGPRPKNNRWIRQVAMQGFFDFFTDTAGRWLERTYQLTLLDLTMQSGDTVNIQIVPAYVYLPNPFRIAAGITLPAGNEYRDTRYSFGFNTANQRKLSGNGNVTVGTFYSGHRRDLSATLNLRPRRGFLATLSSTFNRIELPEGNVSTKILRAVVNTQFNPFLSLSNNIQYDTVSRLLGWQFRFRWILKPGNDIYFVWLNNWLDAGGRLATLDRNAATKIVYTHRL